MIDLHGFGNQLLSGTLVTLELGLVGMGAAVLLGLIFAPMKMAPLWPLRWIATTYTTTIRGIPELLVILLVYFGASRFVNGMADLVGYDGRIEISPFMSGAIALGFAYGAYATEIFRGALRAIPKGQIEAAQAIGMVTDIGTFVPTLTKFVLEGGDGDAAAPDDHPPAGER